MKKSTRLIIIIICAILFLIIAPYIVLYSLGYRVDLANGKIIETGGIYVRVFPQGADVTINSKIKNKTGIFSNSVFVQNLLPKQHNVLIEKEGYHNYQKNLLVKEQVVTKLENVTLFKKEILFDLLKNNADYFSISPNNNILIKADITSKEINFETINLGNSQKNEIVLSIKNGKILDSKWSNDSNSYLLKTNDGYFILNTSNSKLQFTKLPISTDIKEVYFDPENSNQLLFIKNKNLYSTLNNKEMLKDVAGFSIKDQKIVWLSYDGFLYSYDIPNNLDHITKKTGQEGDKINQEELLIKKNSNYKIIFVLGMTFVQEDESLFILNEKLKTFEKFYSSVNDLKASPDGQKIILYNQHEILYSLVNSVSQKILLDKFDTSIGDVYWLNNDYLIFKSGDGIIISEIDTRGNINNINLPILSLIDIEPKKLKSIPEKIIFNQQDKKLYILTEGNLFVSEKLLP